MYKKLYIAVLILFFGLMAVFGVFLFSTDVGVNGLAIKKSSKWIEPAGFGLIAPACASSAPPPAISCDAGGNPSIVITWTDNVGPPGFLSPCQNVNVTFTPGGTFSAGCFPTGTSGSYTWNGASNNVTYSYTVDRDLLGDGSVMHNITSGSFTPTCVPPGPSNHAPVA